MDTAGESSESAPRGPEYGYLCVEAFLEHAVHACAVASALQLGLLDRLAAGAVAVGDLRAAFRAEPRGADLLLSLLVAARVVEVADGRVALTPGFRQALQYRDLLEAKLEFARLALPDVAQLLPVMLHAPDEFRRRSRIYSLFSYGRSVDDTPENCQATARWMRFTTALTRYEGQVLATRPEFARRRRLLDIGGNSGELALQLCRRHPALQVTVLDLPVVCRLGEQHVRGRPEAGRITFLPGDALAGPLPPGHDLVVFKSVLHDWPDAAAREMIRRASEALEPGGTLLIFERGPLELLRRPMPYSLLSILPFAFALRTPDLYVRTLTDLGCEQVDVSWLDLEMPFFLCRADKPAGATSPARARSGGEAG